ncbi:MAG: DUF3108 domain-containing protein [Bacteroidales bacterium]
MIHLHKKYFSGPLAIVVFLLTLVFPLVLPAQNALRHEPNSAYQAGEFLKFRVYYHSLVTGNLTAGYITFDVKDEIKEIYDRETMHVIARGITSKGFGWFFKVDDRYETYIDTRSLAPWKAVRRVNEGGYTINQDYFFDQNRAVGFLRNNKSEVRKEVKTKQYVQDILSIFYYARNFDYGNAREGDIYNVDFMIDDTTYTARIQYGGKEEISTRLGKFRCIKLTPLLDIKGVFDKEDPMVLYVTDDKNRVPLFGESEVSVGSVRIELMEFEGLRNYFSSAIEWND